MRREFIAQMQELRHKIFKKVKPKMINRRTVTGASLLELCEAYTAAINQGSVPCIESAWTYVCKNENQRAASAGVAFYKRELERFIQENDVNDLKLFHEETL